MVYIGQLTLGEGTFAKREMANTFLSCISQVPS